MALDWTSFARDGHETLMLSMLTEHGRATALMWETVSSATLKDNRNRYEDELLYQFSKVVPDAVAVTVVADRGFADCKLFKKPGGRARLRPCDSVARKLLRHQ